MHRKLSLKKKAELPALITEEAGISVGISHDLATAARHSASLLAQQYSNWLRRDRRAAWGHYKQNYFAVAVGGGNTMKANYQAWLDYHLSDINWIAHLRFFFLEESSGESGWESGENSLVLNFLIPLAGKLIKLKGKKAITKALGLESPADTDDIIDRMITVMTNPINLIDVRRALLQEDNTRARRLARAECARYQQDIQSKLGASMAFHYVVSGIGKDGTLGALTPYSKELATKTPGAQVLKQDCGALRVALNRGVIINAEQISLIVSGSHKLKALGRFEMEESAEFEQTVMETPLRMLRETPEIAAKVTIFADEQSLHFEETLFEYSENGYTYQNKAETREGGEPNGIHALLMHGFMGLFSFTNLLIRLPGAWSVSALHRGSDAKDMANDAIFPHYAMALRKAILKNWRQGRPSPVVGHSIAGLISDHLLLSLLDDYDAPIRPYEQLKPENKRLVDALRASGMINLATWAPSDGLNTGENVKGLISHYRNRTPLDFSGFDSIYKSIDDDKLQVAEHLNLAETADSMSGLNRFLHLRIARPLIGGLNQGIRRLLNRRAVQQRMLNSENPYVLRLVNGRLLRRASFYGMVKEINASMHDPQEYQRRHLKALDLVLEYDIPTMTLIHEDDFLVSAVRHRQEHDFLLRKRLEKEGVKKEQELDVPARYVLLKSGRAEPDMDVLNPHLLIMATSSEGNTMARIVTSAMTRFVNETVQRAIRKGQVKPLDSVARWVAQQPRKAVRSKRRKATSN